MEEKPTDYDQVLADLDTLTGKLNAISKSLEQDFKNAAVLNRAKVVPLSVERYDRIMEHLCKSWDAALLATSMTRRILQFLSSAQKNVHLGNFSHHVEEFEGSLEAKKEIVSEMNESLRLMGFAISVVEDGEKQPHILSVVTSRDGKGRFALENRITKKRKGSYKSIRELLPLIFMDDKPREAPSKPKSKRLSKPLIVPKETKKRGKQE